MKISVLLSVAALQPGVFALSSYLTRQLRRPHDETVNSKNLYGFEELRSLDSRLSALEQGAPQVLAGFYEPHLKSFSIKPGSVTRLSVTSTCYSLLAVLAAGDSDLYDSLLTRELVDPKDKRASINNILMELLYSEWRQDDLFQVPVLLYTILRVDAHRTLLKKAVANYEVCSKVQSLIDAVLAARPYRRDGDLQQYSDYIMFQCCRVYSALQDSTEAPPPPDEDQSEKSETETTLGALPIDCLPPGSASQVPLALSRCAETSFNELCRQLAFRAAGDTSFFDAIRLAYSLLTYLQSTKSLAGTAGRELVPGSGPSPGTRPPHVNQRLVVAALAAFFEEQNKSGLWDKGQPIYKSFRRQGRNVGNAFVFAVDTVGSLLESLPAETFRPHLGALEMCLEWIESHQTVEVIPDYCDTETGQCYGKALRGWSSPHLSPGSGPQAWSTAQVITCVSRMKTTIQELINADVLEEFNGIALSEDGVQPAAWDRLLDSDLGRPHEKCRTIKSVLEERFIFPFETSINSPGLGAAYSAILFGPPGTAKTTICESLAQRMGWDFVVIDTAAFLADGLTNVASRIRYVFERLQRLNECVILFDEIEEFCLDRETPGIGMESRMLTTAMLTAINDLRRAKRSVFFLATNRLRAFDSAITRPGRFDLQLFVGTPNLNSRVIQLEQKLAGVAASEEAKQKGIDSYKSFLSSVWSEDAMFMNYLEGVQFASMCADLIASGRELTSEEMSSILKQQVAVMTARGSIRDEFVASMDMSRL
jgi:hypothetical protein